MGSTPHETGLVLIEGCDGTGKTTLARALAAVNGWEYQHEGPPPNKDNFHFYYRMVNDLPCPLVLDRYHTSDYVYPWVLEGRDRKPMEPWQLRAVDQYLAGRGALLVRATATERWVRSCFDQRGEDFVGPEDVPVLIEKYEEAFAWSWLPSTWWMVENGKDPGVLERQMDEILDRAQTLQVRAVQLSRYYGWGSIEEGGQVLLVDQGHPPSDEYLIEAVCRAPSWSGPVRVVWDANPDRLREHLELLNPEVVIDARYKRSVIRLNDWVDDCVRSPIEARLRAAAPSYAIDIYRAFDKVRHAKGKSCS